jgi:hypothetical protein
MRFVKMAVAGLLSVSLTSAAWARAGGAGAGAGTGQAGVAQAGKTGTTTTQVGGISQTPWFSNPAIRTQIGLNDQTFNQLNTTYGQAYGAYNTGVSQLGSTLTPQQRAQKMQDLQATFQQKMDQAIQSTVTDPTQRSRFNQLSLQHQGIGAFSGTMVQQQLNLTTQQKEMLGRFAQQYNQQLATLQQNAQTNPAAVNEQFNRLRLQAVQNINSVLTPQQQQTWQQMTGQPFNFQWSNFFPQPGVQGGTTQP